MTFRYIWLLLITLFHCQTLWANSFYVEPRPSASISQIDYIQVPNHPVLSFDEIRPYFQQSKVTRAHHQLLSLGISDNVTWIRLTIHNSFQTQVHRLITGKTWIDSLDIYTKKDGRWHQEHSGDSNHADEHLVAGVGYVFTLEIPQGNSEVYIRAKSADPMTLPIQLLNVPAARAYDTQVHFTSGLVYGILLALVGFNLVLYMTHKHRYALYYCFYISCFIIVNMSYNGFGFAWFYPDSIFIQNYCTLIFMVLHGISGLIFVSSFLAGHKYIPRLYRLIIMYCLCGFITMLILIAAQKHVIATHLAFNFLSGATLLMIVCGFRSLGKFHDARYFLLAVLTSMLGLLTTTFSVWGVLPYNYYTYNGAVFGVVCEAIILACIVTMRLKAVEKERITDQYLSSYDPLTNIFNRRSFYGHGHPLIQKASHNKTPLSFVMMDIDLFKSINDTHGHHVGDLALSHIARLLKSNIRESDILARWGGEEMAILLPKTTLSQAYACAEHLRTVIAETPLIVDDQEIKITASFGISVLRNHDSLEELFKRADSGLYKAKNQGRNRTEVYN